MANVKISQLTSLATPDAADLLPVVDSSASATKRTTVGAVVGIISGDVNVSADGTATISEFPVSKLQDGTARQLLQTDAAGTGVEWTSDIDIPGTLDVTGATTLDSTLDVTGATTLDSTLSVTGAITQGGNNVVTVGDTGTVTSTMIADGTIVDGDINASAAIAGSKIAPNFGSQTIQTTGVINAGSGSAAAPSVSVGTVDNGIYSSGTDEVAIATNGSGRVYVDASGKVGISAASPGAYLYVPAVSGTTGLQVYGVDSDGFADVEIKSNGTSGASRLYFSDTAGSPGLIRYSHSTNTLEFTANGVEGFRYDGATFQVNGDTVKVATSKTPASASATGTAGEICWDADYIYVCTATDTWKRAALSTW